MGQETYPNGDMNRSVRIPESYSQTSDDKLERKDNSPLKDVVPPHRKAPRRINETDGIGVESAGDWVEDRKFTESVYNVEHHLRICSSE